MNLAKVNRVTALIMTVCVLGAGILTYRLLAVEPQQEEAKKPAPNSEAFTRLQLEMTQKELIQVQAELRKTRLELKFWTAREETFTKLQIPNSVIEDRMNQDPGIAKYLVRLAELREQIAQAEQVSKEGKNAPVIKEYKEQIKTTEATMDGMRKLLQPQIVAQLREKAVDEYKGRLIQWKEQLEFGEEQEKVLKAEVQRLSEGLRAASPANDQRLSLLEKEVRELKEAVDELKKKK